MESSAELDRLRAAIADYRPRVIDALAPLTIFCQTADDVALYLDKERAGGYPGNGLLDPLATWLHERVPGPVFYIFYTDVTVHCPNGGRFRVEFPTHVTAFITAFDAGYYPALNLHRPADDPFPVENRIR